MAARSSRTQRGTKAGDGKAPKHEHTVLVLQGGGALGAYQAGVFEGMHEQGFAPDWVTGVSIGAINGALIAMGYKHRTEVVSGVHILSDLTLGLGTVVHDYLA